MSQLYSVLLHVLLFLPSPDRYNYITNPASTGRLEKILTDHAWKIRELRGAYGNNSVYYQRGRPSISTQSFERECMVFTKNHKGTYHEQSGLEHRLVWHFNKDQTKLTITVWFSPVTTLLWENLQLTENSFRYNESFSQNGTYSHNSVERIPK